MKSAKNAGNSGFSRKFTDTVLTMLAKMCRNMDFGGRCSGLRLVMRICDAPNLCIFIIITHAQVRFWPSVVMLYRRGIFD